jgi:DNA-binding MarR family transcriptional regulator
MRNSCIEISIHGEKNYKLFLDIIKQELDTLKYADINATQAFILMNINENVVTIGELISRGYYIGSNASYNVRKLITNEYIQQNPSDYDKRAVYLKLTKKGTQLCSELDSIIEGYMKLFNKRFDGKFDIAHGIEFLKNVEHFWTDVLRRRL